MYEVWEKKDLFNILYGVPPLYYFNKEFWNENKEKFANSYKRAQPVSKMTGYVNMSDFKILTQDRKVQQSYFENGVRVTVNFKENESYTTKDTKKTISPQGYLIENLEDTDNNPSGDTDNNPSGETGNNQNEISGSEGKKKISGVIIGVIIIVCVSFIVVVVVFIIIIIIKHRKMNDVEPVVVGF